MNKLFVFALLALVAACVATPTEETLPLDPTVATLPAHDQAKRGILYRAPAGIYRAGYEYYPEYDYGYQSHYRSYSYPYYGSRYLI